MKTASKMKTTPKIDIPQENTPQKCRGPVRNKKNLKMQIHTMPSTTIVTLVILHSCLFTSTSAIQIKGAPKETSLNFRRSFCLIFLATNMLEG